MSLADLVARGVSETTKEWSKIKKREERDKQAARRMKDDYWRGHSSRITIKDVAYLYMAKAYAEAAGTRGLANARQIYYAARPAILKATGDSALDSNYFTQTLLPTYQREHRTSTADWDVIYDARGHFTEPHTEHEIDLGTIGVREYLRGVNRSADLKIILPEINSSFPTHGPKNRYGAVLYIEKEGFIPLLKQAAFAERYDLAIMSSKGMGSTAARDLIGHLCHDVKILCVHDFDKSGFSIVGTLTRNTERYRRAEGVEVIDLGLRLADVEEWKLEAEPVSYNGDPSSNLADNGATDEEIEYLQDQRVELNAFTSDDFVSWLESKLKEHGVEKIVPDQKTLEAAYRRAAAINRYRSILAAAEEEVEQYAAKLAVPRNLAKRVRQEFEEDDELAWDDAIESAARIDAEVG